jgi:hypothetical protein
MDMVPQNEIKRPSRLRLAHAAAARLDVGERLPDGTVCAIINRQGRQALALPGDLIGPAMPFNKQADAARAANAGSGLHGHTDWRIATRAERTEIAAGWSKLAAPGSASPWMWSDEPDGKKHALVCKPGAPGSISCYRDKPLAVMLVRDVTL